MNFFCSKDCPDLCGVQAKKTTSGYTFKGMSEDWSETGFVCSKFKIFAEREIDNGILSYEMSGGVKNEISHKSSLKQAAKFLEKYRNRKILYMKGSGSLAYNMAAWNILFSSFENCWTTSGGPCDDTGGDAHEADFGVCVNPDVRNLEDADTIILYGKNAAVCSQHFYAYLKELKKRGKTIVYIDPVKTKTAELADRYIMIKPCCDGLLACALLNELGHEQGANTSELLKKSGVSEEDFKFLTDSIRSGKTAHVEGYGIQRQSNGMNAFRWINRLAVKTGSEDMLYYGQSSKRKWESLAAHFKGEVHIDKIAEALADGEFDLFVNVAANPVMTYPDTNLWKKALVRTPVMVVDTNHTETSEFADFFLKVGGMFSQPDLMGSYFFPHDYTRERLTDEMSDLEAAEGLSELLGFEFNMPSQPKLKTEPARKYKTENLELTIPSKSKGLQLITSSHHAYLNSQILPGMERGLQLIYINPTDAVKLGITDGDCVKIRGEAGAFTAEASLTEDIIQGCVMCWKNIPMLEGYMNNAIPNRLTDSGNGLVYYSHFVEVGLET